MSAGACGTCSFQQLILKNICNSTELSSKWRQQHVGRPLGNQRSSLLWVHGLNQSKCGGWGTRHKRLQAASSPSADGNPASSTYVRSPCRTSRAEAGILAGSYVLDPGRLPQMLNISCSSTQREVSPPLPWAAAEESSGSSVSALLLVSGAVLECMAWVLGTTQEHLPASQLAPLQALQSPSFCDCSWGYNFFPALAFQDRIESRKKKSFLALVLKWHFLIVPFFFILNAARLHELSGLFQPWWFFDSKSNKAH